MGFNKENRTVNASKNTLAALMNKMVILLLHFISRRFFIQYIGVEYLGINGLFSNVLTLLSMADLGLGTAINVSLYKPIVQNDTKRINGLMNLYRKMYRLIALLVFILGMALIPFLKYIVNLDAEIPHLYLYYFIYVLKTTFSYLLVYKAAIVKADQRDYEITNIEIFTNMAKIAIQIVLIIFFKSYFLYALMEVVFMIVHNIVVSYIADKQYGSFLKTDEELSKEEQKGVIKTIYSAFVYKISQTLIDGTDNILMSIITGTISVGLYSNYLTITRNLTQFVNLVFNSFTAGIGNLVVTSESERNHRTFKTMQLAGNWMCGICVVCLTYLMQDFISMWVGPEMKLDKLVVVAIIINMLLSVALSPLRTFREGTGLYQRIKYVMLTTAILNLVLSVFLGKLTINGYNLGVGGILLATSVSQFLTCFWYEPIVLFRECFHRSSREFFLDFIGNCLLVLACIGVSYPIMKLFNKTNIVIWFIKAIILALITSIFYFLRYFKTEEFQDVKRKVLYILNRIKKKLLKQ